MNQIESFADLLVASFFIVLLRPLFRVLIRFYWFCWLDPFMLSLTLLPSVGPSVSFKVSFCTTLLTCEVLDDLTGISPFW